MRVCRFKEMMYSNQSILHGRLNQPTHAARAWILYSDNDWLHRKEYALQDEDTVTKLKGL